MKGKQAVVCAKCGALNRPTWEFCARCSESLEGALAADAAGGARRASDEPRPTGLAANAIALGTALALVVIAFAAWRYASQMPPPEGPNPALFTVPTRPAERPSPPPRTGPGVADYEAGRKLMNAGDLAEAVPRLQAAVDASPGNAEYRSALGFALWRNGDLEGGLASHAEAARLDPRLQMVYARSLDAAGRSAEAVRQYEEILARDPGSPVVAEDLGRLQFRTGDYTKAAPHLQQAVARRPDDPVLRQELAYSLDRSGRHEQAAAAYRQVLEQAPQAVTARGLLASSLATLGKSEEAMAILQEGLKTTPNAPILQRQMGAVLESSGRSADAAASYRAYARLAPNAPDARELLARAARLESEGGTP
jgi:Flp pilus assembly protein TadD